MAYTLYAILIGLGLMLGYCCTRMEYEAVQRFYPGLSFMEYVILGDKLRITPNGE